MGKLTAKEGEWFRRQHGQLLAENSRLREVIKKFADDLQAGGLAGQLLAQELRNRLADVPKR